MRRISLDDLPTVSAWPAVLLGLEPFEPRVKSRAEVLREYEQDKWGPLRAAIDGGGGRWTVHDADRAFIGDGETVLSVGSELQTDTSLLAHAACVDRIANFIGEFLPTAAVAELGAGYGSVLLNLSHRPAFRAVRLLAGEFTTSGIACMDALAAAEGRPVETGHCDFTQERLTELAIPPNAIIYTCMAAPCVPVLSPSFVAGLARYKPSVVLHFEPCIEHCDGSLLGLLRRRYIELNGYNRNLMTLLRAEADAGRIRILREERAFFGENCFLPCSFVAWEPVGGAGLS